MFEFLAKNRVDETKPRSEGITYIIDKIALLDQEKFEILAPMIDIVKIYNVYPILMTESQLKRRIDFYHNHNVKVSIGSTLSEYAIGNNAFEKFVNETSRLGFDLIEIGENNIELSLEQKKKITELISSSNLDYFWKIGKKDHRHQLPIQQMLLKIEDVLSIGTKKVILEANLGFNVGIYDEKGGIKWNLVKALTSKFPPNYFLFESPLESQQSALIAEFGQRVNLAEISLNHVISIESQRRGFLAKSGFNIAYLKETKGGPSSKFVYFIIKTKNPIDQTELINLTNLPRRTIQTAIDELMEQGLIFEKPNFEDGRKKLYYPVQSDWL